MITESPDRRGALMSLGPLSLLILTDATSNSSFPAAWPNAKDAARIKRLARVTPWIIPSLLLCRDVRPGHFVEMARASIIVDLPHRWEKITAPAEWPRMLQLWLVRSTIQTLVGGVRYPA